jgi:hypothetical protein
MLDWEEGVRFVALPHGVEKIRAVLEGVAGHNLERVFEAPLFMNGILSEEKPTGTHAFQVVFEMPDGWDAAREEAFGQINEYLGLT